MKTKITITPKIAQKSGKFTDNRGCLMATALKHRFPNAEYVNVGTTDFYLNKTQEKYIDNPIFPIPSRIQTAIRKAYGDDESLSGFPVVKKSFSFTINIPKELLDKIK